MKLCLRAFKNTRKSNVRVLETAETAGLASSMQILLEINARLKLSLCIGSYCAGFQVVGAWQAAKGFDLALTIPEEGRDWKLRSELTSYAEYPESDSTLHATPC